MTEEKRAKIYCGCAEAEKNCYLTCPKGRRLNPDEVFLIPSWRKSVKGK